MAAGESATAQGMNIVCTDGLDGVHQRGRVRVVTQVAIDIQYGFDVAGTLQGAAEITRCVVCLRTGAWPSRLKDVSEIDVVEEQLALSEHVDDESRRDAIAHAQNIEESARQRGMGGDLQR